MVWPIVKLWAQPEPVDLGNARLELVKSRLGASDQGLTQSEAQTRLKQYGYNELPEEKVNSLLKFLSYFRGPIPWMIEIAAAPGEAVYSGSVLKQGKLMPWFMGPECRTSDDFRNPNAKIAVARAASHHSPGSRFWSPDHRHLARRLWNLYGADRVGLGPFHLGIRFGLAPRQ